MLNTQKRAFKQELRELIKKYDVSINWTCDDDSDLQCVFNDHIEICDNADKTGKPFLIFEDAYIDLDSLDNRCELIIPKVELLS